MRTTVTIDDELFQRALEVADPGTDKADLFREAMKVFVRVQAGKRLAALGGNAADEAGPPPQANLVFRSDGPRAHRHVGLDFAFPQAQSSPADSVVGRPGSVPSHDLH